MRLLRPFGHCVIYTNDRAVILQFPWEKQLAISAVQSEYVTTKKTRRFHT